MSFVDILPWIHIVLSIVLIILILLQTRDSGGLGGAFGGGGDGGTFNKRRGAEKILFNSTIIAGILFAIVSILWLFI
tara:strand:- start:3433 stop:3663 length:231 start_codon:yes stop_codon:yes gene_type:complete